MELKDYIRILRKRWIIIVALMLVGLVGAGAASILTTPLFKASTQVFVSTSQSGGSASDLNAGNSFTLQRVQSYAQTVRTSIVLQPVIKSLGLDLTVGELASKVEAIAPTNTVILEIAVTDADPAAAASIANAIGETLPRVVDEIEKSDSGGVSPVKISTLQPAVTPISPDSPNTRLNLALGFLVGLALGVGIAVFLEILDTRIRSIRDIEQLTDLTVIGGIAFDPEAVKNPLVVQADPRSPRSESFRTLRTNVQFVMVDRRKSFVITSSLPGEGKTTTSTNLAITLAQLGNKVLLIDADLRRPRVSEYLSIEGAVGLTDVLVGRAEFDDVVQPWGEGNLDVLPAGQVPPNPSELLGGNKMVQLIERFEADYDIVIFDCAPLLPVTDAAILARITGGAILVAAAGKTHRNQFLGGLKNLLNVDAPVLGVILTMLPTKGVDSYGYGQYGQYGYTSYASEPAESNGPSKNKAFPIVEESALDVDLPTTRPSKRDKHYED